EVEGRVDHTGLHAFGDIRTQHGFACAALDGDPVAGLDAAVFGVLRVDFEQVFAMPHNVRRTAGLRAHVVLGKYAAGGKQQWEFARAALVAGHVFGNDELAFAAHEFVDVH